MWPTALDSGEMFRVLNLFDIKLLQDIQKEKVSLVS